MSNQFVTVSIGNARIHVLPTTKFKTTTLSVFLQQELTPDYVTKTALLPSVLQRGTETFPDTIQFKRQLESMYGATLFGDVFKRGERHIFHLGMDIANQQYLKTDQNLLQEGLRFFVEALGKPSVRKGGFNESFVKAEKTNLKTKIESLADDKGRYAAQRMIEEMCSQEPYALFNYGIINDLSLIDSKGLYAYYLSCMKTCPIDFYCVGNVSVEEVVDTITTLLPIISTNQRNEIRTHTTSPAVQGVKEVVEEIDVKQGKLNLGCRTHVTIQHTEYPDLLLYNGILGGFPHSKLFTNVREKASLAYYASSRLESFKGLLLIQSGIEIDNYDKAVSIIKQQLEAMKQGEIRTVEIEQTKATLTNQLKEQQDRSMDLIQSHYQNVLSGKSRSVDELIEKVNGVTKNDIIKVAQRIELDTIYFLRDKGGSASGKN